MSNITALDNIIRQIGKEDKIPYNEKLIQIDTKTGLRIKEEGFFKKLFSTVQKYAVSSLETASCKGITHRTKNAITLEVKFDASVPSENEGTVVENLLKGSGATLEEKLNNYVRSWVVDFVRLQEDHIIDLQKELEYHIEENSINTIGLNLNVEVKVKGNIDTIIIKSDGAIGIRVKDYKEDKIFIRFEAELLVLDKTSVLLSTKRTKDLQSTFTEIIRDYFSKYVSLHESCFDLNKTIKTELLSRFNEKALPLGRSIGALSLKNDSEAALKPSFPSIIEYPVEAGIKDYLLKIKVHNKTLFELKDIGKFKNKIPTIENFETWFKKMIESVIQDLLFEATYKQLLLSRSEFEERIKKNVKEKVEEIGFGIKQHTVIPELQELKPLKIDFNRPYATSDSEVLINLQIIVSGKLDEQSLKDLDEKYMAPNTNNNINYAIQQALGELIERKVHLLEPEQMYMKFEDSENGKESIKHYLEAAIQKLLFEEFKISKESLAVYIKRSNNELRQKVTDLMMVSKKFRLDFEPKGGIGQKIPFDVRFKINGVLSHGWGTFQRYHTRDVKRELEEIQEILSENLSISLSTIPFEYLIKTSSDIRILLGQKLDVEVFQKTSEEFGLMIECVNFDRKLTIYETQTTGLEEFNILAIAESQKATAKQLIDSDQALLKDLLDKKRALAKETGYEDEIAEIEEQIKKIQDSSSMDPFNINSRRQMYIEGRAKYTSLNSGQEQHDNKKTE